MTFPAFCGVQRDTVRLFPCTDLGANMLTFAFDGAVGKAVLTIAAIKQRSAMNPILWLAGIGCFFSLVGLFSGYFLFNEKIVTWFFMGCFGFCLLVSFLIAIYYAVYHPERLRSEDYQIKKEAIDMIRYELGNKEEVTEYAARIISTNPMLDK